MGYFAIKDSVAIIMRAEIEFGGGKRKIDTIVLPRETNIALKKMKGRLGMFYVCEQC